MHLHSHRGNLVAQLRAPSLDYGNQQLAPTDAAASATCTAALESVGLLKEATQSLLHDLATRPELAMAVAVPYLKLCGFVVAGWLMAKSSAVAAASLSGPDADFHAAKLRTALFFAEQMLPNALMLARVVRRGALSVVETDSRLV